MKRDFKVIQINGFKGLIIFAFIACCVATGFIMFPSWLCKSVWNFVAVYVPHMPEMTMITGGILWAIIALSYFAIAKPRIAIGLGNHSQMSEAEIDMITNRLKNMDLSQIKEIPSEKLQEHSEEKTEEKNEENLIK